MTAATTAQVATAVNGHVIAENRIAVDGGYLYLGIRDWRAVIDGRVHTLANWRADADEIAAAYRAHQVAAVGGSAVAS